MFDCYEDEWEYFCKAIARIFDPWHGEGYEVQNLKGKKYLQWINYYDISMVLKNNFFNTRYRIKCCH